MRPRRARHAAPRSRHEPLRAGHGRDAYRPRSRPDLDGRPQGCQPRLHRQVGAGGRQARRQSTPVRRPAAARQGRAARPPESRHRTRRGRDHQRQLLAPTLNQSIALARLPAGVEPGNEVEVEIRDKRLKAQVVKPTFVRNGKPSFNLTETHHEHPRQSEIHQIPRMGRSWKPTAPSPSASPTTRRKRWATSSSSNCRTSAARSRPARNAPWSSRSRPPPTSTRRSPAKSWRRTRPPSTRRKASIRTPTPPGCSSSSRPIPPTWPRCSTPPPTPKVEAES